MTSIIKIRVLIDTDILLHYKRLDQIDWAKELDADQVELVILPVVTAELNKHKDIHPTKRLRKRAGEMLKWLNSHLDKGLSVQIREGSILTFADADPKLDYGLHRLDPSCQDDHILAQALQWTEGEPASPLVILTADTGLRVKAKGRKVDVVFWSDNSYKLPDAPDPDEQKIKELERRIRELSGCMPDLKLFLRQDSEYPLMLLGKDKSVIEEEMLMIRQNYPLLPEHPSVPQSSELTANDKSIEIFAPILRHAASIERIYGPLWAKNRDEYNRQVRRYYEDYERYLQMNDFVNSHVLGLSMELKNVGSGVAEDIDIEIAFPEGFFIKEEFSMPLEPTPPARPGAFGHRHTNDVGERIWSNFAAVQNLDRTNSEPNVKGPHVDSSSRTVHYHVMKAKHNRAYPLSPAYLVFANHAVASPFQLDYQLFAANIPKPVTGKLLITVEVKNL